MTRIGVVGTGKMAQAHIRAFKSIEGVEVPCCCDILEDRVNTFADHWKIPGRYTNHRSMAEAEKLDGITIVAPDRVHASISIDLLEMGMPVLCEKPMANSLEEAQNMLRTARGSGVVNMVNYSKRNSSGLQRAHELIESGGIGRIMHVEASYLQSWIATSDMGEWRTDPRWLWRLSKKDGGLGTLGDIGSHIYDMASFLCGDIEEIYCRLETFDKGVEGNRIGEYTLDANDSMVSTVRFQCGALGTIHATRWASGYRNREFIRVYGDKGTVEVDFEKSLDAYRYYSNDAEKWRTVSCKDTPSNYERFVRAIRTGRQDGSDFENGYKIQIYLHYSLLSDSQRRPIEVKSQ
jgi:predicted dehydrogenase